MATYQTRLSSKLRDSLKSLPLIYRLEQRKNLNAKLTHLKNTIQMSFMLECLEFYCLIKFMLKWINLDFYILYFLNFSIWPGSRAVWRRDLIFISQFWGSKGNFNDVSIENSDPFAPKMTLFAPKMTLFSTIMTLLISRLVSAWSLLDYSIFPHVVDIFRW